MFEKMMLRGLVVAAITIAPTGCGNQAAQNSTGGKPVDRSTAHRITCDEFKRAVMKRYGHPFTKATFIEEFGNPSSLTEGDEDIYLNYRLDDGGVSVTAEAGIF
jgi:hypothetical protein